MQECTSQVYEGLITLADPKSSWVAKWQRLDAYVPGVYAVKVVGIVSESGSIPTSLDVMIYDMGMELTAKHEGSVT